MIGGLEKNRIVGFGSILLETPLIYNHSAGAVITKLEDTGNCSDGWLVGDGLGSQRKFVGEAADKAECIAKAKNHSRNATAASYSTGQLRWCYAVFNLSGRNADSSWITCRFREVVGNATANATNTTTEAPAVLRKGPQDSTTDVLGVVIGICVGVILGGAFTAAIVYYRLIYSGKKVLQVVDE